MIGKVRTAFGEAVRVAVHQALGRLPSMESRVAASLDELGASIRELKVDLAETRGSVTANVADLGAQVADARWIEELKSDLAEMRGSLNLRIDAIADTQRTITNKIADLGRKIEEAQSTIELKADIGERGSLLASGSSPDAERRQTIIEKIDDLGQQTSEARLVFENKSFELQKAIAHATGRTDTIGVEIANALAELRNLVAHATGRTDTVGVEVANWLSELRDLVAHGTGRTDSAAAEVASALADLRNLVAHATGRVDALGSETANAIGGQHLFLENKLLDVQQALGELRNATKHVGGLVENGEVRIAGLVGERFRDDMAESLGRLLTIEAAVSRPAEPEGAAVPVPVPDLTFEEALARARADFPRQFADWYDRLSVLELAIAETPIGNLAQAADPYSRAFKSFVERYAIGTVLDVGCGKLGRPVYLSGLNPERLHGLEPMTLEGPFDFPVRRGIGEYLPWGDASFDTVVSATSIDHSLSLDRALDEILRVLVPTGRLLMWVGSNSGAPAFHPEDPDYEPADRFHLFHIDHTWFEPMLEKRFVIADRVVFWTASHEHVFYMLEKTHPSSQHASAEPSESQVSIAGA